MKKMIDFDAISDECIDFSNNHGFHAVLSWSINDQGHIIARFFDAKIREEHNYFIRKI